MIKRHPQLLKPTFDKKPPVHGVYHRIDTADHLPSRAKRRPLIADAAKAAEGRRIWKQMEEDGDIERVSPGANTDWASALHLANKPGGRVRSCTDFRDLNKKTILDAYSLPLLKNFSHKINGFKYLSRVELKFAFFDIPIFPPHKFKTTTVDPWGGTPTSKKISGTEEFQEAKLSNGCATSLRCAKLLQNQLVGNKKAGWIV